MKSMDNLCVSAAVSKPPRHAPPKEDMAASQIVQPALPDRHPSAHCSHASPSVASGVTQPRSVLKKRRVDEDVISTDVSERDNQSKLAKTCEKVRDALPSPSSSSSSSSSLVSEVKKINSTMAADQTATQATVSQPAKKCNESNALLSELDKIAADKSMYSSKQEMHLTSLEDIESTREVTVLIQGFIDKISEDVLTDVFRSFRGFVGLSYDNKKRRCFVKMANPGRAGALLNHLENPGIRVAKHSKPLQGRPLYRANGCDSEESKKKQSKVSEAPSSVQNKYQLSNKSFSGLENSSESSENVSSESQTKQNAMFSHEEMNISSKPFSNNSETAAPARVENNSKMTKKVHSENVESNSETPHAAEELSSKSSRRADSNAGQASNVISRSLEEEEKSNVVQSTSSTSKMKSDSKETCQGRPVEEPKSSSSESVTTIENTIEMSEDPKKKLEDMLHELRSTENKSRIENILDSLLLTNTDILILYTSTIAKLISHRKMLCATNLRPKYISLLERIGKDEQPYVYIRGFNRECSSDIAQDMFSSCRGFMSLRYNNKINACSIMFDSVEHAITLLSHLSMPGIRMTPNSSPLAAQFQFRKQNQTLRKNTSSKIAETKEHNRSASSATTSGDNDTANGSDEKSWMDLAVKDFLKQSSLPNE